MNTTTSNTPTLLNMVGALIVVVVFILIALKLSNISEVLRPLAYNVLDVAIGIPVDCLSDCVSAASTILCEDFYIAKLQFYRFSLGHIKYFI